MPKLVVSARTDTLFRRAGRAFGPKPVEIDVDDKTAAVLKAEPMLVVIEMPRGATLASEDHSKRK